MFFLYFNFSVKSLEFLTFFFHSIGKMNAISFDGCTSVEFTTAKKFLVGKTSFI